MVNVIFETHTHDVELVCVPLQPDDMLSFISSLFLAEASWRMKEPRPEGKRRCGCGAWLQRLVAVSEPNPPPSSETNFL